MKLLVAATHGILTGHTNPDWPTQFEAWLLRRDPEVHVIKRQYWAGPFPRWNCWVKDPLIAKGLVNEIMLGAHYGPVWLVAHSNGAVITLLAMRELVRRGCPVAGIILTGAAVEADIQKSGVVGWWSHFQLDRAIAYSSHEDEVVDGDPSAATAWYGKLRDWAWGRLMWPYGCLGRTGWLLRGKPYVEGPAAEHIFTRWFAGGHSCYWAEDQREKTFELIYQDMAGQPESITQTH